MEYKKRRNVPVETEYREEKKREVSRLVIEENTIYEIDLDCQYRKDCKNKPCNQ